MEIFSCAGQHETNVYHELESQYANRIYVQMQEVQLRLIDTFCTSRILQLAKRNIVQIS